MAFYLKSERDDGMFSDTGVGRRVTDATESPT